MPKEAADLCEKLLRLKAVLDCRNRGNCVHTPIFERRSEEVRNDVVDAVGVWHLPKLGIEVYTDDMSITQTMKNAWDLGREGTEIEKPRGCSGIVPFDEGNGLEDVPALARV